MAETKHRQTERIRKLLEAFDERTTKDRSTEWFTSAMFKKDIGKEYPTEPVIIRRALAIREMLEAMAEPANSKTTHTYEIRDHELIVGVISMGSLGLGKVFPNYITDEEKRVTTVSLRSEMALFGHNVVNYQVLLDKGLEQIIQECQLKIDKFIRIDAYYREMHQALTNAAQVNSQAGLQMKAHSLDECLAAQLQEEEKDFGGRLKSYDQDIERLYQKIQSCPKNAGQDQDAFVLLKGPLIGKLEKQQNIIRNKLDFYQAVIVTCKAVIAYANQFADLAQQMAGRELHPERKHELDEIARVCRKVPAQPAATFHEAIQSIYFLHLTFHSSMNMLSLGRLDQVLQPFFKPEQRQQQLELFECFIIKCAERTVLDQETYIKQDHVDYASDLVTSPSPLDQWVEVDQFLQNIVVGGLTRDGRDATNECSYLILEAYRDLNPFTPGIYARINQYHLGNNSDSDRFLKAVAQTLFATKSGFPVIVNDQALIPALRDYSGIPGEEANDFVVDGCWEPLLNGKNDWTFRMLNLLNILECTLNEATGLSSNPIYLKGTKLSYGTPPADDPGIDFESLKKIMEQHISFFTDQALLSIYSLFLIDQAVNPTPLASGLMEGCLRTGRDRTWGGAKYRLAGIVGSGAPDVVNTLAAIKKWVYDQKVFRMADVINAFRYNYQTSGDPEKQEQQKLYDEIKVKFQSESPKFGNNDPEINEITKWFLDAFYDCIQQSKQLVEDVFLYPPKTEADLKRITSLRYLAGYSGKSMKEEYGEDFDIKFTVGAGTFALYNIMGYGSAATADRDHAGQPIAPNFSPIPGTTKYSIGHLLASFEGLGLHRFAAGVITDVCLEETDLFKDESQAVETLPVDY